MSLGYESLTWLGNGDPAGVVLSQATYEGDGAEDDPVGHGVGEELVEEVKWARRVLVRSRRRQRTHDRVDLSGG